ncbi:PREDICTED: SNF2 domain-containing protein CLASSY 3-like isoform X1 [Camelina sativa]|uniref:SNF2 domain-containing protein CLASSY 3-like isoform X1 n=1 Tax=Camelina sativa TaxID=90675 RepID=A0ABM1QVX4_CAMSA|nr:PREDICTED: SNF2 domain-containing protein CLASSY 3-like isoform X1 [Camelina sativa]
MLWEELAFCSKSIDVSNELPSNMEEILIDETPAAQCKKGNHNLVLDLEVGLKCMNCGFVQREIRSMDESEWGEKITRERRRFDRFDEEENSNILGKLGFEAPNTNSLHEDCVSSEGTVWDKIPGVKSQMYPHQQEGFEFIWRNLAGTIMLNELKDFENSEETGGCIMSHAPGTGKTRLTIIFLQSYLACFPDCKPVIIAPASLLLTWAEEFKKWNISIPFHNLSSLEFTGKESSAALGLLMQKNATARTNNEIRMVKIYSWIKAKSILGISYNLYEKLAGVKDEDKKTKMVREVKPDKELNDIREILMGRPGLLVLDEAHTPRNQRSCIWKTLSKVETQKRILLSGTPFQNNFQELCNVLGLARPKYLEKLTSTLKKSGMTVTKRGKRALGNEINNRGIEELKAVMLPFVHVHKGSILQRSLPGLRECVVVLNPPELQKRVLESIEVTHNRKTKNVFETEHKLSLVSVHPSLVSRCKLSEKERLSIDEALLAQLKKVRLDPKQSVKTRFLMEFVELCEVIKEKVLVFSQYIDPLKLIMKHLVSRFNWNPGEEVLYMHGKLEQKQRQTLINEFNDPKSKAKVFLASTKACSEGISLVGASRVILLDVVWNPAVERQAISRAYRIGQQRIVYTYHLVAKGTPEGPKYCKQAQKDRISELVFACSSRPDKGKEKIAEAVTEDKVLDTMVQRSKLGDMFDNLIIQPKEADLVEGFNILMP